MRSYIIRKFHPLHDLRFATLSAEAERTYNRLYFLAGVIDANGLFIENGHKLSTEEIAYRVRLDPKEITRSIKELQKSGLVHVNGKGPEIIDWKHEQIDLNVKREKDRERQQRHRGVTRDTDVTERDESLSQSVTRIETKTKTQTRVLLLLSKSAQEKLKSNPHWLEEAVAIAETKHLDNPDQYAAGILRNWLTEGRKERPAKSSAKKKTVSKKSQPKLEGDALKVAREKAKKLFAQELETK
jgi:hypothetical protein